MRVRTTIVSAASLLVALGVAALVAYAKREHDFIATISYAHYLAKALQVYVQDHAQFPQDLDTLGRDQELDARALAPPFGSSIQYTRPSTNAPDSTPILIVTYRGREIVVTKDFTRRP
jgi:hypothetical protein